MTRIIPNKDLQMSTAPNLDAVFLARDAIDYLIDSLHIREAMVAAMLDVTTRTLGNWKDENLYQGTGKFLRLRSLYEAVTTAQKAGVSGPAIINMLNQPLPELESDESCSTILHVIVETPDNKLIKSLVTRLAKEYI